MFEACEVRSVRRIDLEAASTRASSPLDDSYLALEAQLHQKLIARYGPISPINTTPAQSITSTANFPRVVAPLLAAPAHSYEFPLFRTAASTPQHIHLPPDSTNDDKDSTGKFIVPCRRADYYLTTRAVGERRARFLLTAIDGDAVRRLSRQRSWALEVPWKVTVVRGGHARRVVTPSVALSIQTLSTKRTKAGKKRRIALRVRQRVHEAAAEADRVALLQKAESDKAKRVRRNREKKLKRRQKKEKERGTTNENV